MALVIKTPPHVETLVRTFPQLMQVILEAGFPYTLPPQSISYILNFEAWINDILEQDQGLALSSIRFFKEGSILVLMTSRELKIIQFGPTRMKHWIHVTTLPPQINMNGLFLSPRHQRVDLTLTFRIIDEFEYKLADLSLSDSQRVRIPLSTQAIVIEPNSEEKINFDDMDHMEEWLHRPSRMNSLSEGWMYHIRDFFIKEEHKKRTSTKDDDEDGNKSTAKRRKTALGSKRINKKK